MSNSNNSSSSGGIGFAGMLTILFIGLKLTGHIDWSWWWVASPLWLSLVLMMIFAVVIFIFVITKEAFKSRKATKQFNKTVDNLRKGKKL